MTLSTLELEELSSANWHKFELLFGDKGACGGCWCTFWRRPKKVHEAGKAGDNKVWLKKFVDTGHIPGVLFTDKGQAVAWISLSPRNEYQALARSRVMAPLDDLPVWSISCFFVAKSHRGRGLTPQMLSLAAQYARRKGALILEGYPIQPASGTMPAAFVWTGLYSSYLQAGFIEVTRRSPTRPIMRLEL